MTTRKQDLLAVFILLALWSLFFWRLLTPAAGDQASITRGDFSGQFVAFAAYQYDRFTNGQVPLWNPYNNSGLPFIADTQAAVFYLPRLLTIALASLSGGWSYHALELEMAFHVLAYSLMLYLLMRRMTLNYTGSLFGALAAAVIGSYGGFLSGYPPQQLAILEAGIWLPAGVLGILEATRAEKPHWRWLVLSGFALGLSWMAGHPQTSWFLTYLLAAYLAYRIYSLKLPWTIFARSLLMIAAIAAGMAAVQLLPGVEYLLRTARVDLTYDAKGNGFPFRDILQFLFPGQVSLFSPLYIGIGGLALVVISLWLRIPEVKFWGLAALVALGLSFGANSVFFPALYNLLPGLRFFRGQERAAYLVANSLAILAGLGTAHLVSVRIEQEAIRHRIRQSLGGILLCCAAGIVLAHTGWLGSAPEDALNSAVFSVIMAVAVLFTLWSMIERPENRLYPWLIIGVLVIDLFTINMDADSTYDPVPSDAQFSSIPPPLIEAVMEDGTGIPYRVDGFRGLTDNFGSLYQIMDMRGISPLFLEGPFRLIEPDRVNPLAWELFAVRYVYTDWQELPVESTIVAVGEDRYGAVNLHRLSNPRPFAHLVYNAEILDSDAFAHALLKNPDFDPRQTVILNRQPNVELSTSIPDLHSAEVVTFEPERFVINVDTSANALLTLAHPDYPGWYATLDNTPVEILRAYGALTAIAVPAGQHQLQMVYDPFSYRVGAVLSLVTWVGVVILTASWVVRKSHANRQ